MTIRLSLVYVCSTILLSALGVKDAAASTWWIFASGPGGSNSYDKETLNRAGDHIFVWRKDVFSKPIEMGGASYDEIQERFDLDCLTGTEQLLAQRSFLDGRFLSGSTTKGAVEPIEPDTINQWLAKQVCK